MSAGIDEKKSTWLALKQQDVPEDPCSNRGWGFQNIIGLLSMKKYTKQEYQYIRNAIDSLESISLEKILSNHDGGYKLWLFSLENLRELSYIMEDNCE